MFFVFAIGTYHGIITAIIALKQLKMQQYFHIIFAEKMGKRSLSFKQTANKPVT